MVAAFKQYIKVRTTAELPRLHLAGKHRHPPSSVLKRVAHYAVKTLQNYRPFVCLSLRDSLQFRRYEKWRSLPCSSDYSCFRHMNVRSTNLRHTNLSTPCRLVHTSKSSLLQLRCQVKLPTSELPTISVPTFKVNTASSVLCLSTTRGIIFWHSNHSHTKVTGAKVALCEHGNYIPKGLHYSLGQGSTELSNKSGLRCLRSSRECVADKCICTD